MSKNLLPIAVGALILIILAGFALLSVDSKPREIAGPLKSDEELQKISLDPKIMNLGKSLYIAQCGRCHGPGGTGGIGSILNDDQWIHGQGRLSDIEKTIRDGVQRKGMPAWGYLLTIDQIDAITIYVKSFSKK